MPNDAAAAVSPPSDTVTPATAPPVLSETALGYARQALSLATRRAYGSHLRAWEAWCQARGAAPAPAAPALVANHLAKLAGTRAYVTLTSRLGAIAQAHALLRLPFDVQDPELRKTLQGIARAHGTRPQHQAAPLLTAAVIKLAGTCGGDLRGERDRTLILLGFAGAFRRSELVKIQVADLAFGPHGLSVFLPRSKADQLGEGSIVHIAANPLTAHCPVAAVQSWLHAAGIKQGWLFRRISRSDTIGRHVRQHRAPLRRRQLVPIHLVARSGNIGQTFERLTEGSGRPGGWVIVSLAACSPDVA